MKKTLIAFLILLLAWPAVAFGPAIQAVVTGGVAADGGCVGCEDLTTYTVVGAAMTVTALKMDTAGTVANNVKAGIYKDFGVDHFSGDLDIDFDFKIVSISADGAYVELAGMVNDSANLTVADQYGDEGFHAWAQTVSGAYKVSIRRDPNFDTATPIAISANTLYFGKLYRSSTTHSIKVFSTSALRTANGVPDVGTDTATPAGVVAYRYFHPGATDNAGAGTKTVNFYVENVKVNAP
jgi:hypothetical protein